MTKWRIVALAAVPMVLIFSACSSGPSTEISAEMEDFKFTPTEWTVAAGEEITVELTNNGSVDHEWVILQPGVTIASEADLPETEEELLADFVYWEDEVGTGETKTLTFTAPAAGTYQIICAIETHFDAGMTGTLTAEAP
ncbi:MAG: cupredoxin domain-containing protein [Acidimicrobiia bacterium]